MDLEAENRRLRKELAESQRANEILKKASAFFAAELELPTQVVVDFIDDNRAQYGVEPIIRVLSDTPARIAVSTYYAVKSRPSSARAVRDDQLAAALHRIYTDNYSCYGARKLWAEINRDGTFGHVARCTVERIMVREGIRGIRRRVKKPATRSADADDCPEDLVDRDFTAARPNMLWVGRHHLHPHAGRMGVRRVRPGRRHPRDRRLAGHQPPAGLAGPRCPRHGTVCPPSGRPGRVRADPPLGPRSSRWIQSVVATP